MSYKWKPNASQRKEFANNMKDADFAENYYSKKTEKKMYDNWKDKDFIPNKEQSNFCFENIDLFITNEQKNAANIVISGYSLNEKVNHSFIHIINELRRK